MVGEVVIPPSKKLEDLIRLSELCVDLLRQNEEFYAEVSEIWKVLLTFNDQTKTHSRQHLKKTI